MILPAACILFTQDPDFVRRQIEVESELARGTSFHILLPLVRFQEEVAAA